VTTQDVRTIVADPDLELLDLLPMPRSASVPSAPSDGNRRDPSLKPEVDSPPTYKALGFDIAAISHGDACAKILEYAREGRARQVHLCNAYTLTLAQRDDELARALAAADLNLPDGAPVAWLGKKAGTDGPVRGPGLTADVFMAGVARDGQPGVRHYLYGGTEGVADDMARELRSRDSRIEIAGTETPPFRPLTTFEVRALARRINASRADLVWIGLGTPRQDYVVAALSPLVNATLVPVGAAFDFISGRVPEAPTFVHGTGFEWMYRLLREPRRLWRRYILDGARFALHLVVGSRSSI
jgi:N-acetylglucosaminyldiphosphoundecaprenol N-acetyl-beta-D-mannosaminyltransferase